MKSIINLTCKLQKINKLFALTAIAAFFTFAAANADAQKTFDRDSLLAEGLRIEQCENKPTVCDQSNEWITGALGTQNSDYREGDSVPYRTIFTGLTAGTVYTVTIEWDTTESSKHAIDYVTSYNATTAAVPCAGFTCVGAPLSAGIPDDPKVTSGPNQIPGDADDIDQVDGVFTAWNVTTLSVASTYGYTGTFAGSSTASISVTFTANSDTVILAWGGHISERIDWGFDNSAVAINGNPYHMRLIGFSHGNVGNQDVSLSAAAVTYPAQIRIIKDAVGTPGGFAPDDFTFSTTNFGTYLPASFTLDDDGGLDSTYSNSVTSANIFEVGTGGTFSGTISEQSAPGWMFTGIQCVSQVPVGITNTTSTTSGATVNANLDEAEILTCTYTNTLLLAAPASISGRVTDAKGNGILGARLTAMNAATGEMTSVSTNSFGNFTISDLEVGNFYIVTVSHRKYNFEDPVQSFTLNEDLTDVVFIGDGN